MNFMNCKFVICYIFVICELLKGRRAYEGEDAEDRESEENIYIFF